MTTTVETQTTTNIPPVADPPEIVVAIVGVPYKVMLAPANCKPVKLDRKVRAELHRTLDLFLNKSGRPDPDNIFCVTVV